eukprot:Gregarina_sp_Poly_1__2852@NODE_1796_length_3310_cov_596_731422_g1168_i0_p1_GENE_NODE_1796_length_3310_cov_596_731422_g1168_i0NODE_1796_length_3310_cov_596_731422_g1168_i0_p1_ORF_typecomplete_len523_score72_23DcuA_DcuB/PF03605_14/6_8e87DcuA_DcuB/PF03605_14/3_3e46Na_H_antiporter/PF03553_14/0_00096Na_H_antiporter/PF03553_14/1_8e04MatC_N/PF07158_11/0_0012MatC_N/PF07158_11/1_8e03MatC_N/PF07158_11/3_7e02CitMHS/PF03600_16/0_51CitMHS/PF03600_16/1_8e04_NODE_1796_length_3310_cov_596_731422_g1168_i04051973
MNSGARVALFVIEFIFLLFFIFVGSRLGGLGIGLAGGFGTLVFCLFFQLEAGALPLEVIEIIMCVIAAIASMQAAGGMAWLVSLAERLMRRNPKYITLVAPMVTFLMTLLAGTGHTAFSTLPVIAEVAKVAGVRPSRPLTVAVTSSQIAICASPISAAVVAFSTFMEPQGVSYVKVLAVMIPSCLLSTILTAFVCNFLGKDLIDDPIYAERWEKGLTKGGPVPRKFQSQKADDLEALAGDAVSTHPSISRHSSSSSAHEGNALAINKNDGSFEDKKLLPGSETSIVAAAKVEPVSEQNPLYVKGLFGLPSQKTSVGIFCFAILFIVVYAILISDTVGITTDPPIGRTHAILTVMLTAGMLIVIACKLDSAKITQQPTFRTGMTAVICVLGVAWMGDTFVSNYLPDIERLAGNVIRSQAWLLSVILFVASCLLYSQGVTVNALYPAALSIGVSNIVAVGSFPAVSALFVLPTYPTLLAAVEMDDTGSTKIGQYIFNHSFIIPGLIHIISSVLISFLFALMIIH